MFDDVFKSTKENALGELMKRELDYRGEQIFRKRINAEVVKGVITRLRDIDVRYSMWYKNVEVSIRTDGDKLVSLLNDYGRGQALANSTIDLVHTAKKEIDKEADFVFKRKSFNAVGDYGSSGKSDLNKLAYHFYLWMESKQYVNSSAFMNTWDLVAPAIELAYKKRVMSIGDVIKVFHERCTHYQQVTEEFDNVIKKLEYAYNI